MLAIFHAAFHIVFHDVGMTKEQTIRSSLQLYWIGPVTLGNTQSSLSHKESNRSAPY